MAEQAEQPELRVYLCRPGGALGALRGLLGRALASGSRAVIFAPSEGLDDLDRELWLGPEGKLLPHGVEGRGEEGRQPILLAEAGAECCGSSSQRGGAVLLLSRCRSGAPPGRVFSPVGSSCYRRGAWGSLNAPPLPDIASLLGRKRTTGAGKRRQAGSLKRGASAHGPQRRLRRPRHHGNAETSRDKTRPRPWNERSPSSSPTRPSATSPVRSTRCWRRRGLRIVAQRRLRLTKEQAESFYAVHPRTPLLRRPRRLHDERAGRRPKFWKGRGAVLHHRDVMGATNPAEAGGGHHPQALRREHRAQLGPRLGLSRERRNRDSRSSSPTTRSSG